MSCLTIKVEIPFCRAGFFGLQLDKSAIVIICNLIQLYSFAV